MKSWSVIGALIAAALLPGCRTGSPRPSDDSPPLFRGLGNHHRAVSSSSSAQRYFDQGLTLAYAFNHDEAIRSFTEATRLDPACAMAHWGIALCHGPHINNPAVPPERAAAAWTALQDALARKGNASPPDRDLIDALAKRYAADPSADRKPLDEAYAAAMREVWRKYPNDADVSTLFAESMMDLRPWDLWLKNGQPQPGTDEILVALEQALRLNPDHPGANHLYIHAVEASLQPERAVAAADRLRTLVPAAGHLVHMPAHIDVRTGKWAQAAEANRVAIRADRSYRKISPRQEFYRIYMAHNHHFLAYACMMEGRRAEAVKAARDMIAGIPDEFVERNGAMIDGYMPIAIETLMRFGLWDELLVEPAPPTNLPITTAFWRFARAVAFAAKGQLDQAETAQGEFHSAVARVPDDALMAINPAKKVLKIAEHMLAGEIAYRRGEIDQSVAELQAAILIEDDLQYMEPPDWVQPVRHTLGAFLVSAKRFEQAEQVYREDLRRWPENGWSLHGLAASLKGRGKFAEAAEIERRFSEAWSRADTKIHASCLCVAMR